jgi:hypothetical protein
LPTLTLKQIVACGLFLAIVIATTLIIESFAISVVTNAFHQQSQIAWFNNFFSRQPSRPLGIYVSVAQTRIRFYAGAIACISALAYFLLNPRFQQYCDSRFNCVEPKKLSRFMSVTRLTIVSSFLVLTLGLALFDTLFYVEHWPFSPYGMYSYSQRWPGPEVTRFRLYGVVGAGDDVEIHLGDHALNLVPLRLESRLGGLYRRDQNELVLIGMRSVLQSCEVERQVSAVILQKVKEVRLYKEEWDTMDADAGNTSKPDRRILVAHVGGTEK